MKVGLKSSYLKYETLFSFSFSSSYSCNVSYFAHADWEAVFSNFKL